MVLAVGVDIVEVARIARARRRPGFEERILTPREREPALSDASLAGRWAAKEAIRKCVALASWQDVEILAGPGGEPRAEVRALPEGHSILVSITHERTHALAVAIRLAVPVS